MQKKHKEGFEVVGDRRAAVLEKIHAQLETWGLTLPDDDPLMLHFGLNDFDRVGETEFWICNEVEEGYCGKYMFLFEGQRCPNHRHRMKHETFNVIKGTVNMTVDGEVRELEKGSVLSMPPETRHTFVAVGGPVLLLEVSKPCIYNDSFFEDKNISVF